MEARLSSGMYQCLSYYFETDDPNDIQFVMDCVSLSFVTDIKLERIKYIDDVTGKLHYETACLVIGRMRDSDTADEFVAAKKMVRKKLDDHFGRSSKL